MSKKVKVRLGIKFKPWMGIFGLGVFLLVFSGTVLGFYKQKEELKNSEIELKNNITELQGKLNQTETEYKALQEVDQVKLNKDLKTEIEGIKKVYKESLTAYENILDLRGNGTKTTKYEEELAKVLGYLADQNLASGSASLVKLNADLKVAMAPVSIPLPENVDKIQSAPDSGFQKQIVETDLGSFLVSVIAADLSNTKVIVDTASESDCRGNCPVMSLAAFASRSGAYAGINGPYFCPATYPSCSGKTNSFDTLIMNKNKTYFNSDNNVYSSVPAAIFSSSSRFVSKSSDWGRDTSVDSVIAAQPLLVFNGVATFGGDGDPKKTGKGNRSFIGATDGKVYIGIVHNSSVADASQVLAKMGIKNALNLDSGGSTALWSGGKYLAGPGRDTPFGILLVRR
jgi:exopolysaccharide biosynthesis protein